MSQFALPLGWPEAERADDFIVTAANEAATRHLARWATWPLPVTLLTGPRRSGRTLLARLFAEATGGVVIDDAERVEEETIFHAWNDAAQRRRPLLIVAAAAPPEWPVALPDLASRLAATPRATIQPPDDALIARLVERGLARRGLDAPAAAIAYLNARIERSYVAVLAVVDAIDRLSLAGGRRLTVALAREALAASRVIEA
ncbi:HdaA/DnaA family protein [Sphingomonas sp.]|uniref:HdaA/DnaA family protein n=1 Tax=Sphingomonas sp. TaxID=28214 RepID=UPI003B00A499